ncbi:tyrosine-type recombinase/integrase [Parvibaculum sp.]|uniref:tyrosine-type recombinase/integrase n=1 Tax=Parvibaculum sp. TaxID=2024848 RepID=UPI003BA9E464
MRLYFKKRGQRKVRLRSTPGTAEFQTEYDAALAGPSADATADHPIITLAKPQTYRWLCEQFCASGEFRQLDPGTQRTRRLILESTFDEPIAPGEKATFADFPLNRISTQALAILRDRKGDLLEAGNMRVRAIRRVFNWAMKQTPPLVRMNPARDVGYRRRASEGHHTWTPEECLAYEKRHPTGSKARLAYTLALYTGQRRSDVVRLGKQHATRKGWLRFTQFKNRNPITLEIPILPALQAEIDAAPTGDLAFLVTEYGRPFSMKGFGAKFRVWCDEAGLPNCSIHGLRKAGAVRAAENGATAHQLMSIFGWLTLAEAERYTRAANQKKLAASVVSLISTKSRG